MYHEWVMDRSYVLLLGGQMIDVLHRCGVVEKADLQGKTGGCSGVRGPDQYSCAITEMVK